MTVKTQDPGVCMLIHGESKVGKTYLGAGSPAPVLILDAEGKTRFIPQRKITWDGRSEPPAADGTWDVCIVTIRDFELMRNVYEWLNSGKHPFNSVVLDSVSELQQRCVDAISGVAQMSQQMWGDLLRRMSQLVRAFRDLVNHPVHPLQAVVIIAMMKEINGRRVPFVQGQLQTLLPYYIDVVGYYTIATSDDQTSVRRLYVTPHPLWDAGDCTGRLGTYIDNPTVPNMLKLIHERSAK